MAEFRTSHTLLRVSIFAILICVLESQRPLNAQVSNSSGPIEANTLVVSNTRYATRQKWIMTDKALKTAVGKMVKKALPTLMREMYQKNLSTPCLSSLLQITTAIKKTKLWAFKMIDASGKFPEGFLSGGLTTLGNYEECVQINVNESRVKLQGQYCSIHVSPSLPEWRPFSSMQITMPELINASTPDTVLGHLSSFIHMLHVVKIKLGLCFPSTCPADDVQKIIQLIPENTGLDWKFDVNRCETLSVLELTSTQIVILYVMGLIALLIISGSIVDRIWDVKDVTQNDTKSTVIEVLRCFSFECNVRKLSHYTCNSNLRFVHGLMFFMLLWIIISNTFMYVNYDVSTNFEEALKIAQNLFYEIILHRTIPIQTLFFLSGFVSAYKWMKSPEQNLSIWKHILKRYLRYTPAYMFALAVIMLTPGWGSGPSWTSHMASTYTNCKANWWANMLYINNFLDSETVCLDHTWLFAVDAQLHIIGIFVLIPLKIRPVIGLMVNFMLIGASLITVALTNVYYDMPPNEMLAFLDQRDRSFYAHHTYFRVYTHLCLYCSGIAVGYLMAVKPKLKISARTSFVLWLFTTTGAFATLCTVHEWRRGEIPSPLVSALYATLSKAAWTAFLAWISIACMTGHGGSVKDFLGWRPFTFFGRLGFLGYLVHPVIITMVMGFKKSHMYIQQFEILYTLLSHIAATYIMAYAFHMFFEAPFLSLTEMFRKKYRTITVCASTSSEENSTNVRQEVMTEKPYRFETKRKYSVKQAQQNMNKTKC